MASLAYHIDTLLYKALAHKRAGVVLGVAIVCLIVAPYYLLTA